MADTVLSDASVAPTWTVACLIRRQEVSFDRLMEPLQDSWRCGGIGFTVHSTYRYSIHSVHPNLIKLPSRNFARDESTRDVCSMSTPNLAAFLA